MRPLHEELKQIRLEKNISLKDISRIMRIRLDYLEHIEEGDYTVTPLPFLRAFLREYAEVVGVDPQLVMQKFDKKVDSIITEDTPKTVKTAEPPQRSAAADVKIITPEKSAEPEETTSAGDKEKSAPKKRKPRKKTTAKKRTTRKKTAKPAEEEPESAKQTEPDTADTAPPEKEDVQTTLFNGDPEPAEDNAAEQNGEQPEAEDRPAADAEDSPAEDTVEIQDESQTELHSEIGDKTSDETPAETPNQSEEESSDDVSAPPEKVTFKRITIIDDDQRREVSRNLNARLAKEKKTSDMQFYGVITIMAATIILIIYLIASGIIF